VNSEKKKDEKPAPATNGGVQDSALPDLLPLPLPLPFPDDLLDLLPLPGEPPLLGSSSRVITW